MSRKRRSRDPFAPAADPALYVPRDAMERALFELMRSIRDPARTTVLLGPPGLGKTLLLHVLADRMREEIDAVYVPDGAMLPSQVCAGVLDRLELPESDVPVASLLALAHERQSEGRGLLLLLDDAGAIPVSTLTELRRLASASVGALALVAAATDGPPADGVIEALGLDTDVVRLLRPMSESEARRYLEARLARARAPRRVRARFDAEAVARLQRESGGNPRELHVRAGELAREAEPASTAAPALPEGGSEDAERAAGAVSDESGCEPEPPRPDRRRRVAEPPPPGRVFRGALIVAAAAVVVVLIRTHLLFEPPPLSRAPEPELRRSLPASASPRPRTTPPVVVAGGEPKAAAVPERLVPVRIDATPWASIQVDGVDVGVTPIAGLPLVAGDHRFRARMPDGRELERTVSVDRERRFVAFE